jgi:hypothetical protein
MKGPPSSNSVTGSFFDGEDEADLAAAVGLLSCSYGTPKSGPIMLPPDVPPVPPLPARFLGKANDASGRNTSQTPQPPHAHALQYSEPGTPANVDVMMQDQQESILDGDTSMKYSRSGSRVDDDDDGVFGTMEE